MASTGDERSILPDGAVVVRFGETPEEAFMKSVRAEARKREKKGLHPLYGLSVGCAPDMDANQIAFLTREWPGLEGKGLPHSTIRESTVGSIRAIGYDVIRDEPPPGHALVMFEEEPTTGDLAKLLGAFGPGRDNPLRASGTKEDSDGQ